MGLGFQLESCSPVGPSDHGDFRAIAIVGNVARRTITRKPTDQYFP